MNIKNKIAVVATVAAVAVMPILTSAALKEFLEQIRGWMGQITGLLFAAATLAFFWGLVKFIWQPEEKEQGKTIMIWGLLAIFVMFSIWAIIKFMQDTTGTNGTDAITPPTVPNLPNQTK